MPLFIQQTEGLSSYQMNFLRALSEGVDSRFATNEIRERYNLGSYSNIARIRQCLLGRDLILVDGNRIKLSDPVFGLWLRRNLFA